MATILGSPEWLSRPRAGAKDGAPHPPSSSSPTEREGRRESLFDRQLEQRGGVWLGHLRLSDEPWRPRAARRAGSLPTRRDERLRGRRAHVEGNSSRDTSLSDDGSGASDGVAEVTFDENTSEHVVGTHDVVHGAASSERVGHRAHRGVEDAETAGGEGDGGSVVGGDPETSVEADALEADTVSPGAPDLDRPRGAAGQRGYRDSASRREARGAPSASTGTRDGVSARLADSERRGGSFSGADYRKRHARARFRRDERRTEDISAPRELVCSLIARPPPAAAGIPGTAGGQGQARALAAGNAMPSTLEARVVRPGSEGWPDAWNPVALLRLFPSVDGREHERVGDDRERSTRRGARDGGTTSLDAFDALAARLAPAPRGGAGDAEGTAEAREKEEAFLTETERARRGEGASARASPTGDADAEEGEGEVPPARATRAATRARAAARAAKGKEAKPAKRAEKKRKREKHEKKKSAERGGVDEEDACANAHGATDADDTASIHSGGSMAGAKAARSNDANATRRRVASFDGFDRSSPERSSTALRVDLEGRYVAFIVSSELLPEDVRRSVALFDEEEEAKEASVSASGGGDGARRERKAGDGASGAPLPSGGGSDSVASGASDDTKELATREGVAEGATAAEDASPGANRSSGEGQPRRSVSRLRRPLWVIVQSDQMETQHDSALQTPVPAPDVQPTRGILRHRHSKPLPPRSTADARDEARPAFPHETDWATDALAFAATGVRKGLLEGPRVDRSFGDAFRLPVDAGFSLDDGGSSPDAHSGASSGDSSGDEGLSGDEGSDGAMDVMAVDRPSSADMDVSARLDAGSTPLGNAGSTPLPGDRPGSGALAETSPPATPPPGTASSLETPPAAPPSIIATGASSNPPPPGAGTSRAATLAERVPTPAPGRGASEENGGGGAPVSDVAARGDDAIPRGVPGGGGHLVPPPRSRRPPSRWTGCGSRCSAST